MYFKVLFLLVIIVILLKNIIEGYNNCAILNYHNTRLNIIKDSKMTMDLGYNPNDYIYKTLLMESDEPLPVNANYWFHEY